MEAPRCPGRFFRHSNGATGGIDPPSGLAGGATFAGAFSGAACCDAAGDADTGSTDPAASCGATAGRLRGTGGRTGITVADLTAGRNGVAECGGKAGLGVIAA